MSTHNTQAGRTITTSDISQNAGREEVSVKEHHNPPLADELSDAKLNEFGVKIQLVCLVKDGMSAREALDRLGIKGSESWVRKLLKRYQERGPAGLVDQRINNGSNRKLLTNEVKEMALAFWYARPAAGPKAIWNSLKGVCAEREITCPKYDVIKKFLKGRPLHDKLVREGKIEVWDKQCRPVVRINITSYANEGGFLDSV